MMTAMGVNAQSYAIGVYRELLWALEGLVEKGEGGRWKVKG